MNLRELRKARGLSIEHIALIAGVHKSTISRAERGVHRLSPTSVVRISKALKVSPSVITAPEVRDDD
jgi:transcriptional regulator with XRE-family HTH domain